MIFPDLHQHLTKVLELADTYLYVLIDEWSSIPSDIQPFLAEFLKRGVLPVQRASVKIGSLEYRSRFISTDGSRNIGFELGADIATAPDLDDYYVYDKNPERLGEAYADILYRHIRSELPENYLETRYAIRSREQFRDKMFTDLATFKELARAAEGVARDLINIFTRAFFDAYKRGRNNIDRKAVIEAAREWFEQDKSQLLDAQLQRVLQRIIDEVIRRKKARSFLLRRDLEKNPVIQRLFDARLLHLMKRGYAGKDDPGVRYNIYTLDYGTYVNLIGTSKAPAIDPAKEPTNRPDVIVPFDDMRTIRSIVLTLNQLL